MDMNLFFRITFLSLWISLGIVRGYYGKKTKTHDSLVGIKDKLKTADSEMGKGLMILTAIITVIGVVGLILYLLAPPWWTWTHLPLGEWIQWIGIIVSTIPLFYLIWVHRHLDNQWSIALEIQENHKLITTGPYRRVRHPMYLGIFVYTIGLCFISIDVLVILFFVFSIWINYRRIPSEEQMMIDQFGEEYIKYMKRTGKLIPSMRRVEQT
ncbi:MAG: isoprenylcysteine carboxylmethyltransferase family protein [Candidatus Thorarchaeota archaeon]